MAQIPHGNFGNVVAEPGRQVTAPIDNSIGNAVSELGRAIGQVDEENKRLESANRLASIENSISQHLDHMEQGIKDNSISVDEVQKFHREGIEAIKQLGMDGLNEDQKANINAHLTRLIGESDRHLEKIIYNRKQEDVRSNLKSLTENMKTVAMKGDLNGAIRNINLAFDEFGDSAGLGAKKEMARKKAVSDIYTSTADFNLTRAYQEGNKDILLDIRKRLQGNEGDAIAPDERSKLLIKSYTYENSIDAAAIREQEKAERERQAREDRSYKAYGEAETMVLEGRTLSKEYIDHLTDVVSGTTLEKQLVELVKAQKDVSLFAGRTPQERQAIIEQFSVAGADKNIGSDPVREKRFKLLKTINEAIERDNQDNPWRSAQERTGLGEIGQFVPNDIQGWQSVFAQRMQKIDEVEHWAGRKVSPLQPEEAEQFGRLIQSLPPDQQSSALAGIGDMIGDSGRIADLARQLKKSGSVVGYALLFGSEKTTQGRYTSELVLRGERALKDKSISVDEKRETGWKGEIARRVGDIYLDQNTRDAVVNAAYYIMAGLTANGNGDIEDAVDLATGGIVELNGSRIPLPYGMPENDFYGKIREVSTADLNIPEGYVMSGNAAMSADDFIKQLPSAQLQHAGQGRYVVKAGSGFITRPDGKPLVIYLGR